MFCILNSKIACLLKLLFVGPIEQINGPATAKQITKNMESSGEIDDIYSKEGVCQEFRGPVCGQYLDRRRVFTTSRNTIGEREKAVSDVIHGLLGVMGSPPSGNADTQSQSNTAQASNSPSNSALNSPSNSALNSASNLDVCSYEAITQALCYFAFPLCEQVIDPSSQRGDGSAEPPSEKARAIPLCRSDCEMISEQICTFEIKKLRSIFTGTFLLIITGDLNQI